jgi:hypothetical protein
LLFGPWWLVYAGAVGPTDIHRHHAVQVVLAPGTRVIGEAGEWPSPAVVGADRPHAIAGAGTGVVVFVDPDATSVSGIDTAADGTDGTSVSGIDTAAGTAALDRLTEGRPATLADAAALVGALTGHEPQRPPARHAAVDAALAILADEPDTPLAALATRAHLSPSRVTHLFTEQVGIPCAPIAAGCASYRRPTPSPRAPR